MKIDLGQVTLTVSDRKHWEAGAWRLSLSRWCSDAPCHLRSSPGRHWVRIRLWRRAWSARYRDPRQPGSPHDG